MTGLANNNESLERELDQILAEYLKQVDSGQAPDIGTLLQQYPQHAADLLELIRASEWVDEMAGPIEEDSLPVTAAFGPAADPQAETLAQIQSERTNNGTAPRQSGAFEQLAQEFRPRMFGGYELLELLGQGGMGVVYKARQINMDRIVAVKMIRSGRFATAEDLQRFYTEAQAAGRLGHSSIVSVHQIGEVEGHHFYSMDYVEGTTLAELAGSDTMTDQRAAAYLIPVAEAIQHAHDNGILHRDLKPANVLIDRMDRPHVTDFGLAKLMGVESGLTASGAALGTPGYMPPEQATGQQLDMGPACDVYSLGAILYALLTGQAPFAGRSTVETILRVIHDDPVSPRQLNPRVSVDLETICLKCLKKRPDERYASAGALAEDLRRFLADEPIAARPVSRLRRAAHWFGQVPLVAAMMGRRVQHPTVWHRRANWALLALPLIGVLGLALNGQQRQWMMPRQLRIATAVPGGEYHEFGTALAASWRRRNRVPAQVLATAGSRENEQLLEAGRVEAALLQATMIGADPVAVVAPLYDDYIHVVVRQDRGLARIEDLAGKRVALGKTNSGMQQTARKLLQVFGVDPASLAKTDAHFMQLRQDPELDAAIITTGTSNPDLRGLLATGQFRLLPIPSDYHLSSAIYHPRVIPQGFYLRAEDGGTDVPSQDVPTVATTTFLVVHQRASDRLVRELLETLYSGPLEGRFDLIPREQAAEWIAFHFHPAARRFFLEAPSSRPSPDP